MDYVGAVGIITAVYVMYAIGRVTKNFKSETILHYSVLDFLILIILDLK